MCYEDNPELCLQHLHCSNAPIHHPMQILETGLKDNLFVITVDGSPAKGGAPAVALWPLCRRGAARYHTGGGEREWGEGIQRPPIQHSGTWATRGTGGAPYSTAKNRIRKRLRQLKSIK